MVPLRPELHPGQIAYNLLITQQMLGHFPAQIIFPDCSNPGGGQLFIYLPPFLFVPYQHSPDRRERVKFLCVCPRPNSAYKRLITKRGLMAALVRPSQPRARENRRCVLPGPPLFPPALHGRGPPVLLQRLLSAARLARVWQGATRRDSQ